MTQHILLQISLYFLLLLAFVKPLGSYMYHVYEGRFTFLSFIENLCYRVCGIDPTQEMSWKVYLYHMLFFNMLGMLLLYCILRSQAFLLWNPLLLSNTEPKLSFNMAASFITNTDWQAYAGETTLSYFSQMLGITTQQFLSAATGMSLLVAFARGLQRRESQTLGNYWVDMTRSIFYILLPLALILALILGTQGVIQNMNPPQTITLLQDKSEQTLPMGPVASQVAITELGSNGGGFFNTNAAHPFQNPNALTNWLEMLAILLIPAALCYTFGLIIRDRRQGWSILSIMLILFIPIALCTIYIEQQTNPLFHTLNVSQEGNLEGKEIRFGIMSSAFWTSLTTATSNGSVNAMLDSYNPLGGLTALWFMHLGEVVFGGVGTGLYSMLMIIILAVFISGLMVGRTPEYLRKKIGPFEIKMACFAVLFVHLPALLLTAIACVTPIGIHSMTNPGSHGFSQILYAFNSMGNNNGSSFAGLQTNLPFYHIGGAIEMLITRFWIAIPVLAIAGSMARKKPTSITAGTLRTHTPLFIFFVVCVTLIVGGLSFFPALALGPIAEHLMLWGSYGR